MPRKIEKTPEEWKAVLAARDAEPLAYAVTRREATERAFTGRFESNKAQGTYRCICCDRALFSSDAKYESGSGWPSFFQPVDAQALESKVDGKLAMARTEIHCADCGAHMGHVFGDGPAPTGLRFCINSASLHFEPS